MNLTQLSKEDDAVSPVIGVILMVAITVILAAVIASFVLGMGPDTAQTPTASFSSEYEEDTSTGGIAGTVTITMNSGETLDVGDLSVSSDQLKDSGGDEFTDASGDRITTQSLNNGAYGLPSSDELTAGTSFQIHVGDEDYEITLIYNSGDTTSTMQTFEA